VSELNEETIIQSGDNVSHLATQGRYNAMISSLYYYEISF
jgi:hypothetical protein